MPRSAGNASVRITAICPLRKLRPGEVFASMWDSFTDAAILTGSLRSGDGKMRPRGSMTRRTRDNPDIRLAQHVMRRVLLHRICHLADCSVLLLFDGYVGRE